MNRRTLILSILVFALTISILVDLESRGILTPVIVPFLSSVATPVSEVVKGNEQIIALSILLVILSILIVKNPPWLPTGYLWVEWSRWQKIGKVRPGYFKFKILGREMKGIDCGGKKIVFLEGDPEDYEVMVSDKTEKITRIFSPSLEQRVLGTFFKPKFKIYAARILENPDDIVKVGWGGEKSFVVEEESGEILEKPDPLEETLPGSDITKREALREIVSKMRNVIWVVPRWRTSDLKRLAEGEINYMDVMVDAEKTVRNVSDLAHYMLEAYRMRVHKSVMISLLSHLDSVKQAFEETDAAFTILAHLYNVDVEEIKRSLTAAGIKHDEKPEDVLEQWLSREERRRALMDRYMKLTSTSPRRRQKKSGLSEKIKQMVTRSKEEENKTTEGQS